MKTMEISPGMRISAERCLLTSDTMFIADLHIGYESALEEEGLHLPRMQTREMIESLMNLIDDFGPERLVVLGDFKHEFSRNLDQEWVEIKSVLSFLTEQTEVVLVRGNHDNYLATITSRMGIPMVESLTEGGITFVHGHMNTDARPLVMAHEHPSIRIMDGVGACVKLPCFLHHPDQAIVVIPAFSPLALGTDMSTVSPEDYLSPVLKGRELGGAQVIACSDIGLLQMGRLADLRGLRV